MDDAKSKARFHCGRAAAWGAAGWLFLLLYVGVSQAEDIVLFAGEIVLVFGVSCCISGVIAYHLVRSLKSWRGARLVEVLCAGVGVSFVSLPLLLFGQLLFLRLSS